MNLYPLLLAALATGPHQETTALDRAVAAFTGKAIGEEGGARTPVDARLRLAACPMVTLAWRTEQHDSVVVSCTGPAWRLFVPVRMTPKPVAPKPTPVTVAAPRSVAPAAVIKRGDPVMIAADANGFSITREGVAMGDAAPGARLLVKVADARAPVQAVAVAAGRATLPGWQE